MIEWDDIANGIVCLMGQARCLEAQADDELYAHQSWPAHPMHATANPYFAGQIAEREMRVWAAVSALRYLKTAAVCPMRGGRRQN